MGKNREGIGEAATYITIFPSNRARERRTLRVLGPTSSARRIGSEKSFSNPEQRDRSGMVFVLTHDSVKSITSPSPSRSGRQVDGKTPATVMSESMTCNFVLLPPPPPHPLILLLSVPSGKEGERPSGITMWLASRADESVCGRGTRPARTHRADGRTDNEAG